MRRLSETCRRGHRWDEQTPILRPNGRTCRVCAAARDREATYKLYGLSAAEKDAMAEVQGGACSICKEQFQSAWHAKLDHDHETGEARSCLCHKCNSGLGLFRDDPELLELAVMYLRAWRA